MVFQKPIKVWNEPLPLTLNLRCFNDTAPKTYGFLGNSLDKNFIKNKGIFENPRNFENLRNLFKNTEFLKNTEFTKNFFQKYIFYNIKYTLQYTIGKSMYKIFSLKCFYLCPFPKQYNNITH